MQEAQQLEFQLRQAVVAHREKQKEADQRFYERRDAQSGESNQEDSVYQAAQVRDAKFFCTSCLIDLAFSTTL